MVWGYFGFYMGEDGYFDKLYVICCYCYMVVWYFGNIINLYIYFVWYGYGGKK